MTPKPLKGNPASWSHAAFAPVARPVRGLMERPDGNNVSVERESLLLAETQMKFNLGVQLLKDQFHIISQAINSGGRIMNLFGMLEVSGSALSAERWRAEVVAANMANAETTRTPARRPLPAADGGVPGAAHAAVSPAAGRFARRARPSPAAGVRMRSRAGR